MDIFALTTVAAVVYGERVPQLWRAVVAVRG
jgi:hypothetical protein